MPIYEYRCESCESVLEVLQRVSEDPLDCCSRCGGRLERIWSSPSLNFNKSTSRSAARHAKLTVEEQAQHERDRLLEHSKKTGIPFNDLFESHE